MKIKTVKKILLIFVILCTLIAAGCAWYAGGIMMVDKLVSRVDELTIYNSIYMLEEGDTIRQRFVPQQEYLNAAELMVVNTTKNSSGELVVQVLDSWGEPLKENKYPLAEIEAGTYKRIDLNAEFLLGENEEYQIYIYQVGATEIPGIVLVPYESGVIENGICFFNDEVIEGKGLAIGYAYGEKEFIGYQFKGRNDITTTVAQIIVILLLGAILAAFVWFFRLQKMKEYLWNYHVFSQINLITVLFSVFLLSAVINKCVTGVKIPVSVYLFLGVAALLLFWTIYLYMRPENKKQRKAIKSVDLYCMLFLVISGVLLRLPMFTNVQRWDGSVYYTHLHAAGMAFDFSWQSVWEGFRIADHPTMSYLFFMLMGEFLFPGQVTGVLLVQLIMSVAGIVCIYQLFRRYWCRMAAVPAMIFTLIVSITPLFLGTFSYVNVDYTLVLFFVFLLYADCRKKTILTAFWTLVLIMNKETGWVIAAGYYIGYFLGIWFNGKEELLKDKMKRMFKNKVLYIILVSGLVLGIYMIRQGGLSAWFSYGEYGKFFATKESILEGGMEVHGIGIYPAYIFYRLGQIFLLNYMWIATLIIIVSCVILIRNKGKMWGKGLHNLSGTICSLLAFVAFSCLYITYALVRYTVFSSVIVWLLALLLLYYVIAPYLQMKHFAAGLGIVSVLLLIQNLWYVDPVSNLLYVRLDSGKGKILSTNMDEDYHGDALVTNYRFSYMDSLLDKLLVEISYDESICIYQYLGEESQIKGVGAYELGWNPENKERKYISEETERRYGELVPLNTWYIKDIRSLKNAQSPLPQKAIVYFLPYNLQDEDRILNMLKNYYQIGEKNKVSNWGGSLYYYWLEKI